MCVFVVLNEGPLWDKFVELDNCSEKPPSKFIGDIGKSEDAFKHYLRSFVKNSYAEVFYTVANRSLLGTLLVATKLSRENHFFVYVQTFSRAPRPLRF